MKVIVVMIISCAGRADGEVLFAVVSYDAVDDSVFAETVEYAVDGGPVYFLGDCFLDHLVTQGSIGGF
jgi:hypothetical protein